MMIDIVRSIDQDIKTLQHAKEILQTGDLDACLCFYENGFHKLPVFKGESEHLGIVDEVNKLILGLLSETLESVGCKAALHTDEDGDISISILHPRFREPIGLLEVPEKQVYLFPKRVTQGLYGGNLQDMDRILGILRRIESVLSEKGYSVQFFSR